jgi:predicted lipid-binding transport protein (Tim44 family)
VKRSDDRVQTGLSFPVDLILFGLIAVFLILRLRSILGRRIGFEKPPQPSRPFMPPGPAPGPAPGRPQAAPGAQPWRQSGPPVIDGKAEPPKATHGVPDPSTPVGQTLARIAASDPQSEPNRFLDSAETAFRSIVTAFATGDRNTLRMLLTDGVFNTFSTVIAAREAAGEHQRTEIRAVLSATIEDARQTGSMNAITVRFVSDQVTLTMDAGNRIVAGTEAVIEIVDIWTFERNPQTPGDGWRLAAARSG